MTFRCDHGMSLSRYCELCVGGDNDGKVAAAAKGFFAGVASTLFMWMLVALLAGCAAMPIGGQYRFTDGLVTIEYEQAVHLDVDCVYPAPPAGSPAAAMVKLMGGLPKGGYGSGVAVGSSTVATARHLVDCDMELPFGAGTLRGEPMKITAKTYSGVTFELAVEEQGESGKDDFALLVAVDGATPFRHWAMPRSMNPHRGETVCVMAAHPWFLRRCGESGVPQSGDKWMGAGYVVYDAHSDPGNSGSGVYDKDGWLVAIHVASVGRAAGGGYMVGSWRGRVSDSAADLGF